MDIRYGMLLGTLLVAGNSTAQTTQVTFTGNLVAATCVVDINGSRSGDGTITLRTVPATALATAGSRAGRLNFGVVVGSADTPCLAQRVQLGFRNNGNVNAQGRLENRGTAGNVELALLNIDDGGLDIDLSSNRNSQIRDIPPTTGWTRLNYAGEYYATAAATGGTVTSSVQYDVIYY